MPNDKEQSGDKAEEKWISIGGKKIRIPAGEEGEELTREVLPSVRGQKESNTKEAQKMYKMRFDLIKSQFKIREPVVFAEYKKSGIVQGINGEIVNILCDNRIYPINKNHVFKKSELLGDRHWDTMTNVDRVQVLINSNLPAFYNKQNWGNLSIEVRTALLKGTAPAGMTTSTVGSTNAVYNPLNEEKTVSDRIKEEIQRQHNTQYEGEKEVDGKEDSKENPKEGKSKSEIKPSKETKEKPEIKSKKIDTGKK